MEEQLWLFIQLSRALQELRKEIGVFWDDEAARDINLRFLDPHETEDQNMRDHYSNQKKFLEEARQYLNEVNNHEFKIREANQQITRCLFESETANRNTRIHLDVYKNLSSNTRDQFYSIKSLLDSASSVCPE